MRAVRLSEVSSVGCHEDQALDGEGHAQDDEDEQCARADVLALLDERNPGSQTFQGQSYSQPKIH